jgi:hypothetical protein
MTMSRKIKAEVTTEADRIRNGGKVECPSPKALMEYGRYYPEAIALKKGVLFARPNRTHNRTREIVIENKMSARRRTGRKRVI